MENKKVLFSVATVSIVVLLVCVVGFYFYKEKNQKLGTPNQQSGALEEHTNASKSCSPVVPTHTSSSVLIFVYDSLTCKPVSEANVSFKTGFVLGRSSENRLKTDAAGVVLIQNAIAGKKDKDAFIQANAFSEDVTIVGGIEVTKKGYIENGFNGGDIPGNEILVRLQRQGTPQRVILIGGGDPVNPAAVGAGQEYHSGDALNLESLLEHSQRAYYSKLPPEAPNSPYDFKFVAVNNDARASNAIGKGSVEVEFAGKGGVQEIPGPTGLGNGANKYYGFFNMTEAPVGGYLKTARLESGHSYVGRTRSGEHYFKFTTFMSKDLQGANFASLKIYIQPDKSRILEFSSLPNSPILEVNSNALLLKSSSDATIDPNLWTNWPNANLTIKNGGPYRTKLQWRIVPKSTNIKVIKLAQSQSLTFDYRPLNKEIIVVVWPGNDLDSFSSANVDVFGDASGSFQVVSNGGVETIVVNFAQ